MAITPAEIIERRRTQLGLSQAQLGERIGRTASTVRRWESGDATPPASLLPTLAAALQVSPRDLEIAFGGDSATPIEEQPTMAAPPPVAPAPAPAPATAVAAPPQRRRSPLQRAPALDQGQGLSYLEDNRQRLRYWLRAALTIVVGIVLLVILMWAFGELRQAIGDVWDLFGDNAPPATSPGTEF
jgi:transcriptional regulator with XRE-family HTH domain